MKGIVIYYSYHNNTRNIAKKIAKAKNYDLLELSPVIPFTTDYQKLVSDEERKMDLRETVQINPIEIDFNQYDAIVLGTPVWWYTLTSPMRTFLRSYDLSSIKKIDAFATNGGWVGHTKEEFSEYVKLNSFLDCTFKGNTHDLKISEAKLEQWIRQL